MRKMPEHIVTVHGEKPGLLTICCEVRILNHIKNASAALVLALKHAVTCQPNGKASAFSEKVRSFKLVIKAKIEGIHRNGVIVKIKGWERDMVCVDFQSRPDNCYTGKLYACARNGSVITAHEFYSILKDICGCGWFDFDHPEDKKTPAGCACGTVPLQNIGEVIDDAKPASLLPYESVSPSPSVEVPADVPAETPVKSLVVSEDIKSARGFSRDEAAMELLFEGLGEVAVSNIITTQQVISLIKDISGVSNGKGVGPMIRCFKKMGLLYEAKIKGYGRGNNSYLITEKAREKYKISSPASSPTAPTSVPEPKPEPQIKPEIVKGVEDSNISDAQYLLAEFTASIQEHVELLESIRSISEQIKGLESELEMLSDKLRSRKHTLITETLAMKPK